MPELFIYPLRVRYGECDPQGIALNANYLLYFDVVFTELWRAAVGSWQDMEARGVDAVVSEANLDFRSPARFDDELLLRAQISRLGKTAITTEIEVVRKQEILVAGWLRHVCVETPTTKDSIRSCPWPADIRAGLAHYAA